MKLRLGEPRLKPHGSRLLKARPAGLRCRFETHEGLWVYEDLKPLQLLQEWLISVSSRLCHIFLCAWFPHELCSQQLTQYHGECQSTLICSGFISFLQPKAIVLSQRRLPWSSSEGQSCPPKAVRWTALWAFLNTSPIYFPLYIVIGESPLPITCGIFMKDVKVQMKMKATLGIIKLIKNKLQLFFKWPLVHWCSEHSWKGIYVLNCFNMFQQWFVEQEKTRTGYKFGR